jgi:large subunit ribosomal protein L29
MTPAEVRNLRDNELKTELAALRAKQHQLTTQTATEKVEDTSQFRKVRKDIARLLTEATSRRAKAGKA